MRDFKLPSKILLILISTLSLQVFAGKSALFVYSYDQKQNIPFDSLLSNEKHNKVLLIDEFCSVCNWLIFEKKIQNSHQLILSVVNEPSFRWKAKLKRHNLKNSLYNISQLNLKLKEVSPQLMLFDGEGKLLEKIYGKSEILKKLSSGNQ